ncbi:MAG: 2-amino-4-hydroxy-6-hydroxymethyldihydropteridine diphosphokinase [bacterium]
MDIYFGLGSNLGNKEVNLINAISLINLIKLDCGGVLKLVRASRIYQTSPVGFNEEECKSGIVPVFLNCAVLYRFYKYRHENNNTNNIADYENIGKDLLFKIKNIEKLIGRKFNFKNNGEALFVKYIPREIDIDILLLDKIIISLPKLNIPHKELKNRKFTLIPLLDINENLIDPITKNLYKNILSDFSATKKGMSQSFKPYGVFSDNYLMINKI